MFAQIRELPALQTSPYDYRSAVFYQDFFGNALDGILTLEKISSFWKSFESWLIIQNKSHQNLARGVLSVQFLEFQNIKRRKHKSKFVEIDTRISGNPQKYVLQLPSLDQAQAVVFLA